MVKPRAIPHLVSRMVERQDRDSWTPGQGTVSRPPTVPSVRPETPTDAPKMVTLADVDPTGLADGDVFIYEAASGLFKPASAGGGGAAPNAWYRMKAGLGLTLADAPAIPWQEDSDSAGLAHPGAGTSDWKIIFDTAGLYLVKWQVAGRLTYTADDARVLIEVIHGLYVGTAHPSDTSSRYSFGGKDSTWWDYLLLNGADVVEVAVGDQYRIEISAHFNIALDSANSPIYGAGEGNLSRDTFLVLVKL